ncbi:DUF4302 domain-containing protein [Aquimarina aggregata]|nr:DUF4302 domain-containing protein [Aquimarina aggregata]
MMLKNIKLYIVLFITLGFIACSSDNEVAPLFDGDIDSRVNERLQSYTNTLVSSEFGWKADYRPQDDSGVYNFYLKFNADNTVEIVSDFNNGTDDLPTTYRIGKSQFPELVFENFSTFHRLFELEGFRLGAEFEFLFEEVTSDMVTFKSKTDAGDNKSTLTLVKATAADKEAVENLQGLDTRIEDGHMTTLPFRGITVANTAAEIVFSGSLAYDDLERVATVISEGDDSSEVVTEIPIEVTEGGLNFVEPVTLAGTAFQEFTYDVTNNNFTSVVDGNTAVIAHASLPLYINNDIFGIGTSPSGSRFLYRPSLGANPLTSAGFDAIVAQINTDLAAFGLVFEQFIFTTDPSATGINTTLTIGFTRPSDGGFFTGIYDFEGSIVDKKLVLTYQGPNPTEGNPGNSGFFEASSLNMINFFGNPDGLIYTDRGPFRSDTSAFSNEAASLLSAQDPSLSVYAVWF